MRLAVAGGSTVLVSSISVIIPAFNAEDTLSVQLQALADQEFAGRLEVIVADNLSTDRTRGTAEGFLGRFSDLKVVSASGARGASHARNAGAAEATTDHLAFCDADDVVAPGWLEAMSVSLDSNDFVTGSIDHESLNQGSGLTHWRSHVNGLPTALHFLPYALSGNMAVSRAAYEKVGGFPEDMRSVGEDVAFSWQMQLAGYELKFERAAVVAYRHRHSLRDLWRQHVAFGVADAVLYKRFGEDGVPAPRSRTVLAAYARLLRKLPWFFIPRKRPSVVRSWAKRWGRLKGSVKERVVYL